MGRSGINSAKEKLSVISRVREAKKRKRYHPDDHPINEVIEDDGPMEISGDEAED